MINLLRQLRKQIKIWWMFRNATYYISCDPACNKGDVATYIAFKKLRNGRFIIEEMETYQALKTPLKDLT